jgi:hypothetical protein
MRKLIFAVVALVVVAVASMADAQQNCQTTCYRGFNGQTTCYTNCY